MATRSANHSHRLNSVPRRVVTRDTRLLEKKGGVVKAGFGNEARPRLSIDKDPRRLVQKLVPIVAMSRLVTGIPNKRFDLLRVEAKCGAGTAHHVLFHHHRAEIVCPV